MRCCLLLPSDQISLTKAGDLAVLHRNIKTAGDCDQPIEDGRHGKFVFPHRLAACRIDRTEHSSFSSAALSGTRAWTTKRPWREMATASSLMSSPRTTQIPPGQSPDADVMTLASDTTPAKVGDMLKQILRPIKIKAETTDFMHTSITSNAIRLSGRYSPRLLA